MKVFNMEFKSQREIILTCKYCSKQLQNRLNNVPIYLFTFFSCFLLTMHSDSIEGIYDTLKQCALISKSAGGIGIKRTQHSLYRQLYSGSKYIMLQMIHVVLLVSAVSC